VLPDVAFDLALEHGRCIGVRIPDADAIVDALAAGLLAPEESTHAMGLPPRRRRTWVCGRIALRRALALEGLDVPAVLADARGAPLLPPGISGSITHKESLAAGLVAREPVARVGVDLELCAERAPAIESRILTDDEALELGRLDAAARGPDLLLRFSAKEAIYKALDPFVRRYVGFKEVSVSTQPDGSARVSSALRNGEGPFAIEVRWRRFEGIVLTTARVMPVA
jgi:enterobactin synthetase component D